MNPNKRYTIASVLFLILSLLVFSYSGYYILGIQTVNLFLALTALAFITSLIAVTKDRKWVIAWILLVVNSVIMICMIYFLTSFKMKM